MFINRLAIVLWSGFLTFTIYCGVMRYPSASIWSASHPNATGFCLGITLVVLASIHASEGDE